MAKQLFPEMARSCRAFLRHKDVLMSPRVLRSYNIQVTQARYELVSKFRMMSENSGQGTDHEPVVE